MSKLDSAEYRMLEALIDQRLRLTEENLHLMARFSGGMQGAHSLQKELLRAELARDFWQSYEQEHGKPPHRVARMRGLRSLPGTSNLLKSRARRDRHGLT